MKTIYKLLLVPAMLIVFSCDHDTVTEPDPENLSAINAKGKKHPVPITNALESDPRTDLPPLACSFFEGFPPESAFAGGGAVFYGNMSHLGKVHGTTVNTFCSYNEDGTLTIHSEDTTVAANGDLLFSEGAIVVTFPTDPNDPIATITGGSDIVGGTGRFEGATGRFDYHDMVFNLVTGHESHTSTGWIMY